MCAPPPYAKHQRLEQLRNLIKPKNNTQNNKAHTHTHTTQTHTQNNNHTPTNKHKKALRPALLALLTAIAMHHVGLLVPLVIMSRNCILPKTPGTAKPKYPACSAADLGRDMTIVVTVKDACSQAPGFIRSLEKFAPANVHLIYTYPNFESCSSINLRPVLKRWKKVTMLPLPLRSSPMQGWYDAVPYIKTKYSMLLHNDGYALDASFGCELLSALKARQASEPESRYHLAAPMLYESKMDGSLAAHATQSNLRLVKDGSPYGFTVHHDHSLRKALNRGSDFEEGEQADFVEDHGFLIETDKIRTVIDPRASFTLEYLDMIMTIRANGWKVLFVPSARLEFRVTEFSWRDIPYFMYKRSEAIAQGTRDYLKVKWQANFPNTGFWTYIKYTIVEQHVYDSHRMGNVGKGVDDAYPSIGSLAWKDQAALVYGFFQMVGYNRYDLTRPGKRVDFLDVLKRLDGGWGGKKSVVASRELARPAITKTRTRFVDTLDEILPYGKPSKAEVSFGLEYLPFAIAKISLPSCERLVPGGAGDVCGLIVEEADACTCWINMPTFKSNSLFMRFAAGFLAAIKVPSRVSTFLEMAFSATRSSTEHVRQLRRYEGEAFSLYTCEHDEPSCAASFSYTKASRLKLFRGAPATPAAVRTALKTLGF